MTYKLKSGIETPFSSKLLSYINDDQYGSLKTLDGFLNRYVDTSKVRFQGQMRDGVYSIYGTDFRSELLLIGFNCPDIKEDVAAIWNKKGYYLSFVTNVIKEIWKSSVILEMYEIKREQVLWKIESEVLKECKARVVELVR